LLASLSICVSQLNSLYIGLIHDRRFDDSVSKGISNAVLIDHVAIRAPGIGAVRCGSSIDTQHDLLSHALESRFVFVSRRIVRLVVEEREGRPIHQSRQVALPGLVAEIKLVDIAEHYIRAE